MYTFESLIGPRGILLTKTAVFFGIRADSSLYTKKTKNHVVLTVT